MSGLDIGKNDEREEGRATEVEVGRNSTSESVVEETLAARVRTA